MRGPPTGNPNMQKPNLYSGDMGQPMRQGPPSGNQPEKRPQNAFTLYIQ